MVLLLIVSRRHDPFYSIQACSDRSNKDLGRTGARLSDRRPGSPNCICVFVYLYMCIWMSDTWEHCFWGPRTICFSKIYHIMVLFKVFQSALFCYPPTIKECGKLYLCICVFVCVYLDVRHLGTLFLRSSYHLLFKNILHHGSFQGFSAPELCGANKWDGMGWISVWGDCMSTVLRC